MLEIFRHRKKMPSKWLHGCDYIGTSNSFYESKFHSANSNDIKMARLMELIGYAIEEWSLEYHLENLPKKILFEQALEAMEAIEISMHNTES